MRSGTAVFRASNTCLLFFLLSSDSVLAVDSNSNGLNDAWEQQYKANGLNMADDDDADGYTNLEESIAGTDPLDSQSQPAIMSLVVAQDPDQVQLSFQTFDGKFYVVSRSDDLSNFAPISRGWIGDGALRRVFLSENGESSTLSPVKAEFWANVDPSSIDGLLGNVNFPRNPDGFTFVDQPRAPEFMATGYGAKLSFWVSPGETGLHTFFLSSGGPAELYYGSSENPLELTKIAEILPSHTGLNKGNWETYATQRSEPLELSASEPVFLAAYYVSQLPNQHLELAWSRPGMNGIQTIRRDHLGPSFFQASAFEAPTLFFRDYDSAESIDPLWPNNTAMDTNADPIIANFERVTGDPGTNAQEFISFDFGSSDHLYATWHFSMFNGHDTANLMFTEGTASAREGPRLKFRDLNGIATLSAGDANGEATQVELQLGTFYRAELVSTLSPVGFEYMTPVGLKTVREDTFDLYVSDMAGNLYASARGLQFRDGSGALDAFTGMRFSWAAQPDIGFDNWEITAGSISGNGYLISNQSDSDNLATRGFFKLTVEETDQDGDSIKDWEEIALGANYPVLFFDQETVAGTPDVDAITALLSESQGEIEVSLYATDAAAFESNFPNTIPDDGTIVISRTGSLTPVTVQLCVAELVETGSTATVCDGSCCMLIGSAGDEAAEPEDYQLIETDGTIITDTVSFAFGEMSKVITVKAINDDINEYPETLNLAIANADDGAYTVSDTQNGASIQIFDLPENPDNLTLFTGTFSQDGAATMPTNAAGTLSATLNGPRTELRIWAQFSGLTSDRTVSHVHKSSESRGPGLIAYGIPETGYEPAPNPDPDNGPDLTMGTLEGHLWNLLGDSMVFPTAGGTASKQAIIDSLFGQNGESPLYYNVHTANNSDGEIWAFFGVNGGSIENPGDAEPAAAPGSEAFPLLTGDLLETEVRRFLNQATFGAKDTEVYAMVQDIENARIGPDGDPSYHRATRFAAWIDEQINATDQTYILDYTLAANFQNFALSGLFDPEIYPEEETREAVRPAVFPQIDRTNSDPESWYLNDIYPVDRSAFFAAEDVGIKVTPGNRSRRRAMVQAMLNGHDQLRQKMGFALQQIVVVSDANAGISRQVYGSANYQDMINHHAFNTYRDVLGFVNWSPIMGYWLSSLQNQKAVDFDGDGLFDAFPDENLARENMQLFSIGLFEIWTDGTLKLSSEGLPRESYTNDDIRELAKIITGLSYRYHSGGYGNWGGLLEDESENSNFTARAANLNVTGMNHLYPLKMFGEYHATGAKTFAGTTIDNTDLTDPTEQGIADIEDAMDWLAGKPGDGLPDFDMVNSHVSTPAFISYRLIQRFTTSNPSREYLHRVATVFKNSEGHLGETIRAILLDPEARSIDLVDTTFGMKKSPLEAYFQMLRSLDAFTFIPLRTLNGQEVVPYDTAPGLYTNDDLYLATFGYPDEQINNHEMNTRFMPNTYSARGSNPYGLQMDPLSQETVFNYYLPDFSPGGAITAAGLVAPEMQLANEQDIIRNINYFEAITRSDYGRNGSRLGGDPSSQNTAFGFVADPVTGELPTGEEPSDNNRERFARQEMADAFYPQTEPNPPTINIQSNPLPEASTPHWVRLTRSGNEFVACESSDGVNWSEITRQVVPMASEVYAGLAVCSARANSLVTAQLSNVAVAGGDGTWLNSDIGAVVVAGSMNAPGADSFEIQASGRDHVSTQDDEFHFVYQSMVGDGEIIARVDELALLRDRAKAGVMIRETLAPNSANVYSYLTRVGDVDASYRDRSGMSVADEALLDALDLRLTNGLFKLRYPYDPTDNDDPNVPGVDERLRNPREIIIDAITDAYGDAFDGIDDGSDRLNKFSDALYLLTLSPEYQIRK